MFSGASIGSAGSSSVRERGTFSSTAHLDDVLTELARATQYYHEAALGPSHQENAWPGPACTATG